MKIINTLFIRNYLFISSIRLSELFTHVYSFSPQPSPMSCHTTLCTWGSPGPHGSPEVLVCDRAVEPSWHSCPSPFPAAWAMLWHWLHPLQICSPEAEQGLGAGEVWGNGTVKGVGREYKTPFLALPSSSADRKQPQPASRLAAQGETSDLEVSVDFQGPLASPQGPLASWCLTGADTGWTGGAPALLTAVEGGSQVCSFSHLVIIHDYYTQNLLDFLKKLWLEIHPFFLHPLYCFVSGKMTKERTVEGRDILEETKSDI